MEDQKRGRGRPPTPPDEKLELRGIRLKPRHWEKVDLYGMDWLRRLIERGKPPKPEDNDE